MTELLLPPELTIRNIELFFFKRRNQLLNSNEFKMDFSSVEYIEVGCFYYIMSFILYGCKNKKQIKIALPKSLNVRNIFRIWRFPVVLKELTNISFKDFVLEDDLKYFGENKSLTGDYYDIIGSNEEGAIRLCERGFFSLTYLPFNEANKKNSLINETKRWEDIFIKSVLMKHLEKYDNNTENLLPRIIIRECLTNSYRHPKANSLITSSFFDKKGRVFTITYWDDGDSILETIKAPIMKGEIVKAQFDELQFESLFSSFYVKYVDEYSHEHISVINSNEIPLKTDEDYKMLLSTFFPGISRDPKGYDNYLDNKEIDVKSPGMGLTYLLKVVIDIFEGSLAVRTSDYFMNFSKSSPKTDLKIEEKELFFEKKYKCKIQSIPESDSYFVGNMITIRLPLKV